MHILAENFRAYSLKKKVVKIERIAVYIYRARSLCNKLFG